MTIRIVQNPDFLKIRTALIFGNKSNPTFGSSNKLNKTNYETPND